MGNKAKTPQRPVCESGFCSPPIAIDNWFFFLTSFIYHPLPKPPNVHKNKILSQ